jgi:hypothetical protein
MAIIVGSIIVIAALTILTGLTVWSSRRIDSLARRGHPTAREAHRHEQGE